MAEVSAAMKVINNEKCSTREGKQRAMNDYQNKLSRSPNEADLNKRHSLKNIGTMKLIINDKHAFNGGTKIFKNKNQNRSTSGGF